jgi:2-amino-4-hydroxy-6-hydroxymethyldihydropteridine diphosphokinase
MNSKLSIVYIAIGSNLNNPPFQVKKAIKAINSLSNTNLISHSSLYKTKPLDFKNHPNYANAVIKISTYFSPILLLKALKNIEFNHGRVYNERWGPRIIDLDILLYDNLILNSQTLTIPHSQLRFRDFVLLPLLEISPELILPTGEKLKTIANNNKEVYIINKTTLVYNSSTFSNSVI